MTLSRTSTLGEALFDELIQVQLSFSALLKIIFYLNLPVDLTGHTRDDQTRRTRSSATMARQTDASRSSIGGGFEHAGAKGRVSSIDNGRFSAKRLSSQAMLDDQAIHLINAGVYETSAVDDDGGGSSANGGTRRSISRCGTGTGRTESGGTPQRSGGSRWRKTLMPPRRLKRCASVFDAARNTTMLDVCRRTGGSRGGRSGGLRCVNLRLRQGRIYAVVGVHASSKEQLLRLIAKETYPTQGEVIVPSHLKIVHVEQAPQLMRHLSLLENLTLGCTHVTPSIDRVCYVCSELGLSSRWINLMRTSAHHKEEKELQLAEQARLRQQTVASAVSAELASNDIDENDREQLARLSPRDCRIVHLARAILADPNLLVLHWPHSALDEDIASKVFRVLRRFVEEKGVGLDSSGESYRQQRTVVFSCSTLDGNAIDAADDVIVVESPLGGATLLRGDGPRRSSQMIDGAALGAADGGGAGSTLISRMKAMCQGSMDAADDDDDSDDELGIADRGGSTRESAVMTEASVMAEASVVADAFILAESSTAPRWSAVDDSVLDVQMIGARVSLALESSDQSPPEGSQSARGNKRYASLDYAQLL